MSGGYKLSGTCEQSVFPLGKTQKSLLPARLEDDEKKLWFSESALFYDSSASSADLVVVFFCESSSRFVLSQKRLPFSRMDSSQSLHSVSTIFFNSFFIFSIMKNMENGKGLLPGSVRLRSIFQVVSTFLFRSVGNKTSLARSAQDLLFPFCCCFC